MTFVKIYILDRLINAIVIIGLFIPYFSWSQTQSEIGRLKYVGRYIDVVKQKYYDKQFKVDITFHENLIGRVSGTGGSQKKASQLEIAKALEGAAATWTNAGTFLEFTDSTTWSSGKIFDPDENASNNVNKIGFAGITELPNTFPPPKFEEGEVIISGFTILKYLPFSLLDTTKWFYPAIAGGDIFLNPYLNYRIFPDSGSTNGEYDIISVITHELGHLAGLGHHPDAIQGVDLMFPSLELNTMKRTLGSTDLFSIELLYGGFDIGQTSLLSSLNFNVKGIEGLKDKVSKTNSGSKVYCRLNRGSFLNGSPFSFVPCISGDLIFTPIPSAPCFPDYTMKLRSKRLTQGEIINKGWDKNLCTGSLIHSNDKCYYYEYNVSIAQIYVQSDVINFTKQIQVNKNDAFKIDPTVSFSLNNSPFSGFWNYNKDKFVSVNNLVVKHEKLQKLNSGSKYTIVITEKSNNNNSDISTGMRFKYFEPNLLLKDTTITKDITAGTITMDNVQVNNYVEIKAAQQIKMLSGTHLTAGHYFTNDSISCGGFTGKKSMVQNNNSSSTAETALTDLFPIVETPLQPQLLIQNSTLKISKSTPTPLVAYL